MKKEREDVREFVNQLELVTRLEPRDAFFGGRTNRPIELTGWSRRRGNSVRRVYLLVPLGKQELCLSRGASYHHHPSSNIEGGRCIDNEFWVGEIYRVTTLKFAFWRVYPT